jgi:hypothetical protein
MNNCREDLKILMKVQLSKAFKGAHAVYGVTSWNPQAKVHDELSDGKRMADVAEEQGVKYFVWSSLHNAEKISNGKWPTAHFTQKNQVEEYLASTRDLGVVLYRPPCFVG